MNLSKSKSQKELEKRATKIAHRFMQIAKNEKRIEDKLLSGIMGICESEGIKINWESDIKEMNKKVWGTLRNRADCSSGVYIYTSNKSTGKSVSTKNYKPPVIYVNYDESVGIKSGLWVLAHELGHHFAIKYNNDSSEIGADNMIRTIAEFCLDPYEIFNIETTLGIYSDGVSYYFNKDKPEEGRVYFDMTAHVQKIYNMEKIYKNFIKDIIIKRNSKKL